MDVAVIVPNWNGRRWLAQCLQALREQTRPPDEIVVVDNGSTDDSLSAIAADPKLQVIELGRNTGFAYAANRGIEAAQSEAVALVNTDVLLAPDCLQRMLEVLERDPGRAGVACKMLQMGDERSVYDAGDFLRRDGACEQRGRYQRDDPSLDVPCEVFSPCAGAAVYRRSAVLSVGGFDERLFSYLEDVDLGLRLRLAGWRCMYEPAVAIHAGGGSSWQLDPPVEHWVQRNTLLVIAKAFPIRWLPLVAYRQLGWAWHAQRERRLKTQIKATLAALPLLGAMLAERRRLRRDAVVPIKLVIPSRAVWGAKLSRQLVDAAETASRQARETAVRSGPP